MRWTRKMAIPAARDLLQAVRDRADNPSRTEVHRRGRGKHRDRVGRCPRIAWIPQESGGVRLGIPDDGWTEAAVLAAMPGLEITNAGPFG